jgi:DNA-binding MarR family transcriptional regulator
MNPTDYLMNIQLTTKLHESLLKKICVKYNLSLIEGKILCFLHNNPTKDTAADIVELRMLSKGNVSSAIDKLCKQGYIQRVPDKNNRRKIHLSLLSKADDINKDVDLMLIDYKQKIFDGFTMEEMHAYENLCQRIYFNVKKSMDNNN